MKNLSRIFFLACAALLLGQIALPGASIPTASAAPEALASMPYFRKPVVPGATISGYFDHSQVDDRVVFYDGRKNNDPAYGFYFSCTSPNMWDFVGCTDNVAGEGNCPNSHELWYDEHHGTDYEYASNWHTGAYCDPDRFAGITNPVYAPAAGQVLFAGYDSNRPANGWHIRLKHDLNGNGNYNDDNFRSVYLHFTANALAVTAGQIVKEGQYLGLGGSTGYSSSPHLHFEVQRSSDYFQTNYWPVDPYGWQGAGSDPYPYANVSLWRNPVVLPKVAYIPMLVRQIPPCVTCGERLANRGFEDGHSVWVEQGVQLIAKVGDPNLNVTPYQGSWLAWMGGRNSATDVLYQDFTIPDGAATATFSYYLDMITTDGGGVFDTMTVRLLDTDGNVLKQLDAVDNTFTPANRWLLRSINLTDLSAWDGQTVRLSFTATTDATYQTSFYLDSVSFRITSP